MSIQRAQFEIPSSEFVDWIIYLDEEKKKLKKIDYYLARIAAEIRLANINNDKPVNIEDFLLVIEQETPIELKEHMKMKQAKTFFNRLTSVYGKRKR